MNINLLATFFDLIKSMFTIWFGSITVTFWKSIACQTYIWIYDYKFLLKHNKTCAQHVSSAALGIWHMMATFTNTLFLFPNFCLLLKFLRNSWYLVHSEVCRLHRLIVKWTFNTLPLQSQSAACIVFVINNT